MASEPSDREEDRSEGRAMKPIFTTDTTLHGKNAALAENAVKFFRAPKASGACLGHRQIS